MAKFIPVEIFLVAIFMGCATASRRADSSPILATRSQNPPKFENAHALIPEKRTLYHSFFYTV